MSDQYYPFYVGDYLRDTGDLTLLEHGAYHILLHHYYTMNGLPSDRTKLYRICRAFSADEQRAINNIVDRYFKENGEGKISNRKADKVIEKRDAFLEQQSQKGKKSAETRWGNRDKKVTGVITTVVTDAQPDCNLPSPSPSPSLNPSLEQPCSSGDELFGVFWKMYPRKIGKVKAKSAWKKIKQPKMVLNRITEALKWQTTSAQWLRDNGQYVPNPATYLNQGRWEDEPDGEQENRKRGGVNIFDNDDGEEELGRAGDA